MDVFKIQIVFETGLSDFHKMTESVLKSYFPMGSFM